MKKNSRNHNCILAVAPNSRGFGYAVIENDFQFVDWGLKAVKQEKNAGCLTRIKDLIKRYCPDMVVVEDCAAKGSRRSLRVRKLNEQIAELAKEQKLKVKLIPRLKVIKTICPGSQGTKFMVAKALAKRFPEELGSHLPPERRAWMCEDSRMAVFDAVALAFVVSH